MSKGTLSRICSFSSEDPNHPASNLLKPDTFRKWKCMEPGEKDAFVIIQLDKVEKIMSIDVGNEGSAFIEIAVSRSGGAEQEFQVIQNQTAFMTVAESKEETCMNRVKMFSSSLVKSVAAEKWDLVKVSCIQPFNRRIQYGIAFINIIIQGEPVKATSIGGFRVLQEPITQDVPSNDPIRIGSFFAKKMAAGADIAKAEKLPSTTCPSPQLLVSPAAKIRTASAIATNGDKTTGGFITSNMTSSTSTLAQRIGAISGINDTPKKLNSGSASVQLPVTLPNSVPGTSRGADAGKNKQCPSNSPHRPTFPSSPASSQLRSKVQQTVDQNSCISNSQKPKKPFQKLFEGVVFSMSGFENPYRSTLRRKAVEMGAQCKADWNSSCTHLICAFVNTPKFRQVKSSRNGKVVTKNWIEDSYRLRCRFPWRRYCLDKADKGNESEEEMHAIEDGESSDSESNTGFSLAIDVLDSQESGIVLDRQLSDRCEGQENDENSESRISELKLGGGTKRKRVARISSSSEDAEDDAAYDAETEVDEPGSHTNDSSDEFNHHRNKYNDFFNSKSFLLQGSELLTEDQKKEIEEIIERHKGRVTSSSGAAVDYIVTNDRTWTDELSQLSSKCSNAMVVREAWINSCAREKALVEIESFIIPSEL